MPTELTLEFGQSWIPGFLVFVSHTDSSGSVLPMAGGCLLCHGVWLVALPSYLEDRAHLLLSVCCVSA